MSIKNIVTGLDKNGSTVTCVVKQPSPKDYREAQLAYNKALREALDSGAMLRQRLQEVLVQQNIWSEERQKEYDDVVKQIHTNEDLLNVGGFKLSDAYGVALKTRELRNKFRYLISERQSYEADCAEGQADNARFNFLVTKCVFKEDGTTKVWSSVEDYDQNGSDEWAVRAASKLAEIMYNLDSEYDTNLVENKFLVKYKFARKDLRLVNKDGHLVDANGKLINEDGRFVSYREDGSQYFVDRDGNEVNDQGEKVVKFSPFLDDDGSPILENVEDSATVGEDQAVEEVKKTKAKKPSKD